MVTSIELLPFPALLRGMSITGSVLQLSLLLRFSALFAFQFGFTLKFILQAMNFDEFVKNFVSLFIYFYRY